MKWMLVTACAAAISLACVPGALAKGCIKGAVVGGAAGHMAGHGKLGAAAGCVVGHHEANKKDPNDANAQQQAPSGQKSDLSSVFVTERLNQHGKCRGRLAAARVVEVVACEGRAPIRQHANELALRNVRLSVSLRQVGKA
jgi:hypothetical protein